jgi:hypothetical protein
MHLATTSSTCEAVPRTTSERGGLSTLTKYEKLLALLFVLTLPLTNPWVRGDGVGYYAYARSLLIEQQLNFEKDWQHGNDSFLMGRVGADGRVLPNQYTATGHLANLWTVGPSLLWAPFLIATHLGVLLCDRLGAHVAADGFSAPYLITVAISTSLYGFLGLWISFCLARKYFEERWAFLATLGIWWASSLPIYIYFNPSWSHAHSAFVVSLFLWYWRKTRVARTLAQWIFLGLISGLMVNVYYPNGVLLLIPMLEAIACYRRAWVSPAHGGMAIPRLLSPHVAYVVAFAVALLPTLVSRQIIFGSALRTGYMPASTWKWTSPQFWNVLFSSDHGLLSWTPILILALVGLVFFKRTDEPLATSLIAVFLAFYSVIAFYPDWDGTSSFGNRFFVSLTPLFVLGLAAFFDRVSRALREQRAMVFASSVTTLLILWNLGLVFQWGTHLIPARGPISWRQAAHNQVVEVPERAFADLRAYLGHREALMRRLEQEDVGQLKQRQEAEGNR